MELRHYLRALWTYGSAVVLIVIVSTVTVFLLTSSATKVYTAEARLVVTAGLGVDGTGTDNVLAAPRVAQTYATLATTRPVLLEVIEGAGLPYDPTELGLRLSATADRDTPFITVTMTDEDPERAAAAANIVTEVLVRTGTIPGTAGDPDVPLLTIVQDAAVPDDPSAPRVLFSTALAAAASLVLALTLVAVLAYTHASPALRGQSRA